VNNPSVSLKDFIHAVQQHFDPHSHLEKEEGGEPPRSLAIDFHSYSYFQLFFIFPVAHM
jgi:hypothetical protein